MSDQVYIITGETGSYSDQLLWYVASFDREQDAKDYCKLLNDWLKENFLLETNVDEYHKWQVYNRIEGPDMRPTECPYDENFDCYKSDGAKYNVVAVKRGEPLLKKWKERSGS
jgi:hypothetical protein